MRELKGKSNLRFAWRLSRRDFGRIAARAGAGLVLADALSSASARAATPKRGGSFKAGMDDGSTSDSLDPGTWSNYFTAVFGLSFFGACLTQINEKNEAVPNLADSFETTDAMTWSFKLKPGLTFHDGRSLTSKDVVATMNYHRGPSSKSAAKSLLSGVTNVQADGTTAITFRLKNPNVDFPFLLSDYHLPIYPAAGQEDIDWKKGVGAGPFVLESFQPGVQVTGKRFANYHKPGMPYFDDVTLLAILDDAARTNALITGDIQFLSRVNFNTIEFLKRNPSIEVDSVTGTNQYQAPMNVTVPPFDNVDVRLALKWAIDREEMVQKIVRGYGRPGNDNPIGPSTKFAIQPEPVFQYDPEKARFHLKKAGLGQLKIDLSASDVAFGGAVDAALLMQTSASKAGIDINVVREAGDGYWDNVWMKKPWCMSNWGGRPTCDYAFSTLYTADSAWNDTFWKNPHFNELVQNARGERDGAKRQAMYAEAQQLIHDDGGAVILLFRDNVWAHSKAVAHGALNSNVTNDGQLFLERWWFA